MQKRKRIAEPTRGEPLPGHSTSHESASTSAPPSTPPSATHVSAAGFRHSLLPEDLRDTSEVESTPFICMSLTRLQAILDLVACPDCGSKLVNKSTMKYFDCTVNIKCEECAKIVHHSETNTCKNSKFGEGNVMFVYHSIVEGYGRAGLSRLSAAMGTKEMSTTTYIDREHYMYNKMNKYYDEHQYITKRCVDY